jgi:predicted dehydrogenase
MLSDPEIDVIYNSLPNSLHAEWTIKACQAGKHVLCEKPLAMSVAEVEAIESSARQAGVIVTEAFMYRHHAQTKKVQEIVNSGQLGELRLVRGSFSFLLDNPQNIRLAPELGGGSIWDVGCYPISYARTVIGSEPVEVCGWQLSGPGGVDIFFTGQMLFAGDITAQFDSGFSAPGRAMMEITGRDGTLVIFHPYKPGRSETLRLVGRGREENIKVRGGDLYLGEVEDLEQAILDGKPPLIGLADSRANVAAITALVRSARERHTVKMA